jgi:hypothetical protein
MIKSVIFLVSSMTAATAAFAQTEDICPTNGDYTEPLLTVADFDGNGEVTGQDIAIIAKAVANGEYIAFFDRNADNKLTRQDQLLAVEDLDRSSTRLDQQVAAVFWATERYRDIDVARKEGFRYFTQENKGHGFHFSRLPLKLDSDSEVDPTYQNILDDSIDITQPEGLNYDADGNLLAVFYYQGYNVKNIALAKARDDLPAFLDELNYGLEVGYLHRDHYLPYHAFDGEDDVWHRHIGGCWDGLSYLRMQRPSQVIPVFNQHMTPNECAQSATIPGVYAWNPAFNMLHLWLYKLNPCGKFSGSHPQVAIGAPEEPFYQPLEDWAQKMGLPVLPGHSGHSH